MRVVPALVLFSLAGLLLVSAAPTASAVYTCGWGPVPAVVIADEGRCNGEGCHGEYVGAVLIASQDSCNGDGQRTRPLLPPINGVNN